MRITQGFIYLVVPFLLIFKEMNRNEKQNINYLVILQKNKLKLFSKFFKLNKIVIHQEKK